MNDHAPKDYLHPDDRDAGPSAPIAWLIAATAAGWLAIVVLAVEELAR